MTTKNIQDVVAERVEQLIDVFKKRFHITVSDEADREAEKKLFDPKMAYEIGNYYWENTSRHRKSRLLAWILK